MNFLVKHVVLNVLAAQAVKYGAQGVERALAKYKPEIHQQYVETVTEMWDAKIEAFVLRNARLIPDAAESVLDDPSFAEAKQQVKDLFDAFLKKGENEK